MVGSVTELPFEDGTFDAVLALDLLEHVPAQDRALALAELTRVTARRAVVGWPCGERALRADRRLARYYRLLRRGTPGWLDEHLELGFPERELLRATLSRHGSLRQHPYERSPLTSS